VVRRFAGVVVAPPGCVAEEGGVPYVWSGLPMPLPWVPRKALYESRFKDPVDVGVLA
jgi:hypothetical protein